MNFIFRKYRFFSFYLLCNLFLVFNALSQNIVVNEVPDGCGFLRASFRIDTGDPNVTVTDVTWNLGRGALDNSVILNPEALYSAPGDYTITATGNFSNGNPFNLTATATVRTPPEAIINVTGLNTGTCQLAPVQVNFDGTASNDPEGGALTYFWVLGDGTVSNQPTLTHTYDTPGTYNVTLTVTDEEGCAVTTTLNQDIVVGEGFNLTFNSTGQQQTCNLPNTIQFEATHDVGNYEYAWSFGDGTTSDLQNPEHTYTETGIYDVSLTITDLDEGCAITLNEPAYVVIAELEPELALTGDNFGCAPLFTTFENVSNIIFPNQQVTWDFGDGTTLSGLATADSLIAPFHTYNTPGIYDVTLTVSDTTTGCVGSFTLEDAVEVPELPVPDFMADNTGFCTETDITVNFTDNSTNAVSWEWDFGDGNTSTEQNPTHTYAAFGSYTVTLTVTGPGGCTAEIVREDYIQAEPTTAYFGAFEAGGCAPDFTTTLVDSTSAAVNITAYTWTITNARTGEVLDPVYTGIDPLITIQDTGVYNVTLDVETAEGCNSSFTRNNFFSVGVPPTSMDFTPSATLICNGTTVDFTNNSVVDPNNPYEVTWGWDYLGLDTIMSTGFDGSYTYDDSDPNPVNVSLYAFSNGCVDTLTIEGAVVIELPKANFDTYTVPCVPDSLFLADASMGADRLTWEITVDGTTTTINNERNPVVFVPPGANWSVTQIAENDDARNGDGCTHSTTQTGTQPTFGAPDFSGIDLTTLSTGICFPAEFQIDGSGVTIEGSTITNYYWDFGNGQTRSGQSNRITYDEPGFYSVSLIITSEQGCKYDTLLPDFVKVYGPEINFEVCDAGTCRDREVTFRDLSSSIAPIATWEWDFDNDGIIDATGPNPDPYVYGRVNDPQWNFYWAKLTVTDELGCTATDSVKVRPTKPIPDYDIIQQPDCGGEMVGFINVDSLSQGLKPFNAEWYFSDGQVTGGLEPVLFFEGNTQGIDYTGELILFDLNGCADTVDIAFTVTTDSLIAGFDSDYTGNPECPPYTVNFTDTSFVMNPVNIEGFGENRPIDWIWNFGDGNQLAGTPNPAYTYTEPGTYDVTLITQDSLGCFDTLVVEDYITIDGPQGDLIVSDTIGYPDLTVDFTAQPENPDHVITWDFGNGEFGEGDNTQYTYTQPGVYLAGLILLDEASGCQDLVGTQRVEVLPCPVVRDTVFDYCVSGGDLLLDAFDSTHVLRLGTMNYVWTDVTDAANPIALGDSAGITIVPPPEVNQTATPETRIYQLEVFVSDLTHNYTDATDPTVNPEVKCEQAVTYEVTFLPSPEAAFNYVVSCAVLQNIVPGVPNVQINDASIANGNAITNWYWDTNNDSLFTEQVGLNAITFTADSAGIYNIGLVVETAGNGCQDTIRSSVYVPGADFGTGLTCAMQEIQFSDSTIYDANLGEATYSWDFDEDGNPDSNEQNPVFTYDTPGDKIVTLTVDVPISDGAGGVDFCQLTATRTVTVNPTPDASFTVLSSCLGTPTIFEGSANPNIISYIWDYGNDGTIDTVTTSNTISRIYETNGEQGMALTVVSADSCTDTQVNNFTIVPSPVADFIPNNCDISGITFTDLSTIDSSEVSTFIVSREIDLNDGQGFRPITNLNNFTTDFDEPGAYPITYRITSDLGCTDDTTKVLTIPEADFMVENICLGEEAQFLDQSATFGSAIILYEWDFNNDGTIDAQGTSASFAYPEVGTFEATLTITNISGCSASITKEINVREAPVVEATPDLFLCVGDSVELTASISSLNTIVGVEWDNNAGSGESVIVAPSETTLYTVVATDETGCTGEDFVLVNVIDLPYIPADTLICEGNSFTIDATIPGGIPAVYSWNTGSIDPVIEITEPGTYTVNAIATGFDVAGRECEFTRTIEVQFNTSPLPIEDEITACFLENGALDINLPTNFVNVEWRSDVLDNPVLANEISIDMEGMYYVSATNELGCELSDSVFVRELCEPLVFLPDAFTPNGDGLNDGFEVKGANFLNYQLTIYNRWGEMVFQTTDKDQSWMGDFNGDPLPAGLYPYVVKFESELDPGEEIVRYGNVNLIR